MWEKQIEATLNHKSSTRYVMLCSNQLVGAALIIFVKADILEDIRNVETAIKKVYSLRKRKRG